MNLPRAHKDEQHYLTHDQVEDLATATGYPADPSKHSGLDTRTNETYRLLVLLLAYTGAASGRWPRCGWAGSTCVGIGP